MDHSDFPAPQDKPIQSGEESPHSTTCRFTARYVFPGNAPPLEPGTVEITGGIITDLEHGRDPLARDLGNAAIIPGLVNAHTHLEFSDLPTPLRPPSPFADWIRSIVAHRRERTADVAQIIQRGLDESLRSGTTCIGEIATADPPSTSQGFSEIPGMWTRGVVFRELLGFAPEMIEPQLAAGRSFLDRQPAGKRIRFGLSPHAPYSVHPELFEKSVALAADRSAPLAVHLAETREELQLLHRGTGPLAEMLRAFGVWRDGIVSAGTTAMDYLRLLADAPRVAIVHGNYLSDDELSFLSRRENFSLIYCPRTHAYFQHDPHPWRRVIELGGQVALGTDSRASNPDLSLWHELCLLRKIAPELSDVELLRLGTVNGAAALGLQDECGTLQPGRPADLAAVELRGDGLFDAANRIAAVMAGGKWL